MYPEVSLDGNIVQIRTDNDGHSCMVASGEASKQVFMVYLLENVILWSGEGFSKGIRGCRGDIKNNRKTGAEIMRSA